MKRWPIIRHARWLVATIRWNLWWHRTGRHLGLFPNDRDLAWLGAIWRGDETPQFRARRSPWPNPRASRAPLGCLLPAAAFLGVVLAAALAKAWLS